MDHKKQAEYFLQRAKQKQENITPRERLYIEAAEKSLYRDQLGTVDTLEELLKKYPRDILAAKLCQGQCFNLGLSGRMLEAVEDTFQALKYSEKYYHIYGMKAFALTEVRRWRLIGRI